jgi:hypothetical protein
MGDTDAPSGSPGGRERESPWLWATVLAIHPVLTAVALFGTALFAFVSTATLSLQLPEYLPLFPGALALISFAMAHLYTPLYVTGLALDLRQVRQTGGAWAPSRWFLLGSGPQLVYLIAPLVQAYGVETFDELVFGTLEMAALLATGVITTRYLHARDRNLPGTPPLVSPWSGVWSCATRE